MANDDAARGLVPLRHYKGGHVRTNRYTIADGYSTSLFKGDPVALTGTSDNVGIATAGDGNEVLGVFQGCEYVDANGEQQFSPYWPASTSILSGTTAYAHVIDDPGVVYVIQCDSGTSMAAADIGLNAALVSGTGSTATGLSGWELDASSKATTATLQLRILRFAQGYNTDQSENGAGEHANVEVLINQSGIADGVVGVS